MPEKKNVPTKFGNHGLIGTAADGFAAGPEEVYNVEAVDQKFLDAEAKGKNNVIYLGQLETSSPTQTDLDNFGALQATALFQSPALKTGYTVRDALDRDWRYVEDEIEIVPPTITITTQPQSANVTAGSISGSLSVAANSNSAASSLSYQWYSNNTNSNSNGTAVVGATSASFTIPTTLTAGTYFYYAQVSGTKGEASVESNVATVTVAAAVVDNRMYDPKDGSYYNVITAAGLYWTSENYAYAGNGAFYNNAGSEPFSGAGRLYTPEEATQNAPQGWRLPTEAEINALVVAAGGGSTGITGLKSTTWSGTNVLNFNLLPAGYKSGGAFSYLNERMCIWLGDENGRRFYLLASSTSAQFSTNATNYACSIRYVKSV